jgi:hypothetical protein
MRPVDPVELGRMGHELDLVTALASFGEDVAGDLYLVSRTDSVFGLTDRSIPRRRRSC